MSQVQTYCTWIGRLVKFTLDGGQSLAVYNIVTGDETWVYCFGPGKKVHSAVWGEVPLKIYGRNLKIGTLIRK